MMMHELCDAPLAVGGFDPHMNVDHLNKIFGDLMPIYKKLKSDGRPQPNEGEFRAYYIMLKLDNHTGFQVSFTFKEYVLFVARIGMSLFFSGVVAQRILIG